MMAGGLSGAQTSLSKFSLAKNAYLARLAVINPGQAIDALKEDIRKEKLRGKQFIAETKACHEYNLKMKVQI